MRSNDLENALIERLDKYFQNTAKDYVIKESSDIPHLILTIEMTIYNFFVVRVSIERNTVFSSIVQSGFLLPLLKNSLSDSDLDQMPEQLDKEIRLRIPDKYLKAKGWLR